VKSDKLEIGRILQLKFRNQKSQIEQSEQNAPIGLSNLRFLISKFELQDSSDFELVRFHDFPGPISASV